MPGRGTQLPACARPRVERALALALCLGLTCVGCSGSDSSPAGSGGGVTLSGGASGAGGAGGQAGVGGSGGSAAGAAGQAGSAGAPFDGPLLLSETGLYADIGQAQLSAGVIGYEVQYPLWSDGAAKRRYLLVPAGARIDTQEMGNWVFPEGTTAWKEFERDGVRVETRMIRKLAAGWQLVSYLWRDDLSDADAAAQGVENARGTPHDVPSQEQCGECHRRADSINGEPGGYRFLGLSALQLSRASGPSALSELAGSGLLSQPPDREYQAPGDPSSSAALGYLHGNCGHCHSPSHPIGARVSMQLELRLDQQTLEETGFYSTTIGLQTNHVIAGTDIRVVPGDPSASQLYVRMGLRDLEQMPPLGTELVDVAARADVAQLISGLP